MNTVTNRAVSWKYRIIMDDGDEHIVSVDYDNEWKVWSATLVLTHEGKEPEDAVKGIIAQCLTLSKTNIQGAK